MCHLDMYFETVFGDGHSVYSLGHACDDKTILDAPMLIRNKKDFEKLIEIVLKQDQEDFIRNTREAITSNTHVIGIYQQFVKKNIHTKRTYWSTSNIANILLN